ncbi:MULTISPECIES: 3-deoxy-manno-octulosonate cytidylyltransferase [Sinorhizobium]|uniref:Manno-octulosonate cytidylyltransferase n=1 Tax=Sinorhizobium chiapasense TaxID=501572 RepID=A0ABZ2BG65_9HYPH|nr:manno-octulosonate cytidylyltransferase [Sinorhizobium mexicanum]MBP1884848.1 3-deoxy-manno-octulosonate cytidylyltransferase (CMP-KDO synthetase) [Sinorhizobium mexicanum]
MSHSKRIIIVPARFASTRFPGKPLVELNGKTAIRHTIDVARKVRGIDAIYVATDDVRIANDVESYGCAAIFTSASCRNGTERVAEAAGTLGLDGGDLVVNLQGDAPLTPPSFIEHVLEFLNGRPEADAVTPVLRCDRSNYLRIAADIRNNRVGATTSVFDARGRALYFSKALVPSGTSAETLAELPVYHHVGLYGYRVSCLKGFGELPIGPLEQAEKLEQLRFLENGLCMYVLQEHDDGTEFWELNNPEDVSHLERTLPKPTA